MNVCHILDVRGLFVENGHGIDQSGICNNCKSLFMVEAESHGKGVTDILENGPKVGRPSSHSPAQNGGDPGDCGGRGAEGMRAQLPSSGILNLVFHVQRLSGKLVEGNILRENLFAGVGPYVVTDFFKVVV